VTEAAAAGAGVRVEPAIPPPSLDHLAWPFFDAAHRRLAAEVAAWCAEHLPVAQSTMTTDQVDAASRRLVAAMGAAGILKHGSVAPDGSGRIGVLDLCVIRELLAFHDGLADNAFAMQGLGMGPVSLRGSPEQRRWLAETRSGRAIAAFALTEPEAGSDVAAMAASYRAEGDGFVLNGEKTWISNGGIADIYTIFARAADGAYGAVAADSADGIDATRAAGSAIEPNDNGSAREGLRARPGPRSSVAYAAFLVQADAPGLEVAERLTTSAPHPLGRLRLRDVRVPRGALIGAAGDGMRIALATLDHFRPSVGAAALGMARRAMSEALERVRRRRLFGGPMSDLQMVQGHIADMAVDIDAAALLVYRAAWAKDGGRERISAEGATAKLFATEAAQRVIDAAVQLHGAEGVRLGGHVELLYREIRALRIYEGASDVMRSVIARERLKG